MKKFFTVALLGVSAASLFASEPTTMLVHRSDSPTPVTCVVSDQTSFSFGGSPRVLMFDKADASIEAVPLAAIEKITFNVPNGVESVAETASQLRLLSNPVYDRLSIGGVDAAANHKLAVYDMTGRLHVYIPAWTGGDVDVSSLTAGFYILKISNQTFKFIKK